MHINLIKVQRNINTYQKEQKWYIQGQIDKIRNSVEDSMVDSIWSEQKKEHREGKTKSYQPRGKNISRISLKTLLKSLVNL